jgi:hypothetical protein
MDWLFSPPGSYLVGVCIILVAIVVFLNLDKIKQWFKGKELSELEIDFGLAKGKIADKDKSPVKSKDQPAEAGVNFGKGNDFSGAKVKDIAGRDIRRGGAGKTKGGKTPGVDFGEDGNFTEAEVEDIAGRDIVED